MAGSFFLHFYDVFHLLVKPSKRNMDFVIIFGIAVLTLPILVLCVKKRDNFYTQEEIEAGLENIKRKTDAEARPDNDQRKPSYLRRDTFLF